MPGRAGLRSALALAAVLVLPLTASAAGGGGSATEHQKWSFSGFTGHFDQGQLQRGFQVYKEVCAACHNLRLVKYRNLGDAGGPGFSEAVIKELAKASSFPEVNDNGKVAQRDGRPSDPIILAPYKNEQEARATYNGALPPDLSLMAKARSAHAEMPWYKEPVKWAIDIATGYQEGGPDYLHALLTGYVEPPAYREEAGRLVLLPEEQAGKTPLRCVSVDKGEAGKPDTCNKLADGMNYNRSFPGFQIAMTEPLYVPKNPAKPQIKYTDGSPATQDQYARDVTAFLMWAAEPKLDQRKRIGAQVLLYLAITSLLLWLAKRRLWARIEH